ncbi:MAG: hypothetical protein DLM65_04540, partial [Candidatus Aeolococcus gillhamiae]
TVDLDTQSYFAVADNRDLDYEERLRQYRVLADRQLDVDHYLEFCERHLAHVDEACVEWVESDEFDRMLISTVISTYPEHEREMFLGHFRGLLGLWAHDQHVAASA